MRLYFDTSQPNYTNRLPTIREKELLYIVCACPFAFEEDEARNVLETRPLLISIAWAVVKDMSFKFESTRPLTPSKGSDLLSNGTSPRKRTRMSSPSPAKRLPKKTRPSSPEDKDGKEDTSRSITIEASPPQTPTPSGITQNIRNGMVTLPLIHSYISLMASFLRNKQHL
jgi:hypothetical protein